MIRFIGVLIGMFSIMAMQLILATVLPVISKEIGGGNLYGWVFSGYMIASLVTIPLFSKLADIYGKRKFFIIGMAIFVIGSLCGSISSSMSQLVVARIVQGMAAGIVTPVTLAMISDMFAPEKRGNMIGFFGMVQLLANLLSPLIGSGITRYLNWHWIFYFSIILVMVSMIIVLSGENYKEEKSLIKMSEIDIMGGIVFGVLSALIVYFFNTYFKTFNWDIESILLCTFMVLITILLVMIERSHPNPVIRIEFFKHRILRRSIVSSVLAGAILYALITMLPLVGDLLSKNGFRVNLSGILFIFMIGNTAGLLIGSRVVYKFKQSSKVLWILIVPSLLSCVYAINANNVMLFLTANFLTGMCLGGIMTAVLINSQNNIGSSDRTVLSGLIQVGRYFGASIGIALLIGIIPEVNAINQISQFNGGFYALIVLAGVGVVNEIL